MNEAVATFGAKVDAELQKCEGKTTAEVERKQNAVLQKYIGTDKPSAARGQFSDPALLFKAQSGG